MHKQFPRIFYVLTPICAAALTLAGLELVLALFSPVPFASEFNMYFEPDPHTGFRQKPHSRGRFHRAREASVNSHGHRDDEIRLDKPPGTLRILVLGDSFTMGASVDQHETYAQVLEQVLAREGISPVEVVNAGVGAWSPFQYAQYYEHHGRRFDPDMVLVGFFVGNDTFNERHRVDELRTAVLGRRVSRAAADDAGRLTRAKIVLYPNSHLYRLFVNRRRFVVEDDELGRPGEARDSDSFTAEYLQVQARRMRKNHLKSEPATHRRMDNAIRQILRIKSIADRASAPMSVVLIPDENQINPALPRLLLKPEELDRYDLRMPQTLLIEKFQQRSVPVIDLLDAFLADDRRLYLNDTHWSPAGHRLAAEMIFRRIRPIAREVHRRIQAESRSGAGA